MCLPGFTNLLVISICYWSSLPRLLITGKGAEQITILKRGITGFIPKHLHTFGGPEVVYSFGAFHLNALIICSHIRFIFKNTVFCYRQLGLN